MEQETKAKLKEIKALFRLRMNGAVSKSMREKGVGYGINWGISLPDLKKIASDYGKDSSLAIELWKENIRECKILATMIMPPEHMEVDLAELWASEIPNSEIAEIAAFYLFQHIGSAKYLSFKWISSSDKIMQICGYQVISGLFSKKVALDDRDINEFIDQAACIIEGDDVVLRRTVINAISRLYQSQCDYSKIIEAAFRKYNLYIF